MTESRQPLKPSRNGYLPINGMSLDHEVHGELGASERFRPGLVNC
ncbi:hypothetical protein ABZ942_33010 [Nocardia sp. NPDC046473]